MSHQSLTLAISNARRERDDTKALKLWMEDAGKVGMTFLAFAKIDPMKDIDEETELKRISEARSEKTVRWSKYGADHKEGARS